MIAAAFFSVLGETNTGWWALQKLRSTEDRKCMRHNINIRWESYPAIHKQEINIRKDAEGGDHLSLSERGGWSELSFFWIRIGIMMMRRNIVVVVPNWADTPRLPGVSSLTPSQRHTYFSPESQLLNVYLTNQLTNHPPYQPCSRCTMV